MAFFFQIQLDYFVPTEGSWICPAAKDRKTVLRMAVQGQLFQDSSNKMWQLQETIILETNFIRIYVLNYIFLSSNILSNSLGIIPGGGGVAKFSAPVQTGPVAHPASCTTGTGSFSGV